MSTVKSKVAMLIKRVSSTTSSCDYVNTTSQSMHSTDTEVAKQQQ